MALSTSTNWIFNFILAFITPPLFGAIDGAFYFILVASCLTALQVVWMFYPETAGKTLEELGEVFGDQKVGVHVVEQILRRDGGKGGVMDMEEVVMEPGQLVPAAMIAAASLAPASEETLLARGDSDSLKKSSIAGSSASKLDGRDT